MQRRSLPILLGGLLFAQVPPDEAIDDELLLARIEANCEILRTGGELHTVAALQQRAARGPVVAELPPIATLAVAPVDLQQRLRRSVWIVGHYYPCEDCKAWHFSASTGFAIGRAGLLATCWHLLVDDPGMPGAFLCAADWQGRVIPITAVVAGSVEDDIAILQCPKQDLVPLPLRPGARAGERIYCLSNPDHLFACFSEGLIARSYVVRGPAPGTQRDAPALDAARPVEHVRRAALGEPQSTFLQVTCEFAVGSSGAPIVDAAGNVVGIAQSTATLLADPDASIGDTQMVARSAVPAAVLRQLIKL